MNLNYADLADKYAFYYHNELSSKNPANRDFWRAKGAGFIAAIEIIMGCRVYAYTVRKDSRKDSRKAEYAVHIGDYRATVIFDL